MGLLNTITGLPYVLHYLIATGVFVGAVLLFVFGFKSAEEPSFSKLKSDKLTNKKKKGKEKKPTDGNVTPTETKPKVNSTPKTNSTPKMKNKTVDGKEKKNKTLNEAKNTINIKNTKNQSTEKSAKKGKENKSNADFSDDEGNWQQVLIHKKNRKAFNVANVVPSNEKPKSDKGNDAKNSKQSGKKPKENKVKNEDQHIEKKMKDDGAGDWQEAKSSKKRRKIIREE